MGKLVRKGGVVVLGSARDYAHHEAGHAVVALLNGFEIGPGGVTLDFTDSPLVAREGSGDGRAPSDHEFVSLALRQIEVNFAGPCAEARFRDGRWGGLDRMKRAGKIVDRDFPHSADVNNALRALVEASKVIDCSGAIEFAVERLHSFFWTRPGWDLIRRVATALYQRKKLSRDEVASFVKGHPAREIWAELQGGDRSCPPALTARFEPDPARPVALGG